MKIKDIESTVGTLSAPSKMPCFSFSIPAKLCITGQKLRDVKNSICSKCYALKGRYVKLELEIKNADLYAFYFR